MRRVFCCVPFVVTVLCVVFFSQLLLADDIPFKISDYIPEKLVDFQWYFKGGLQLSGNDATRRNDDADSMRRYYEDRDNSWNRQDLNLSTSLRYRYETVQEFLTTDLSLYTRYDRGTEDYNSTEFQSFGREEMIEGTGSTRSFSMNLRPSIDAGKYVYRDFFAAANGYVSFAYSEKPTDRDRFHRRHYYFDGEYYSVSKSYTTTDRPTDNRQWTIGLEVLPGWGRVYDGVFASTALYMIEELQKNQLLKRVPTRDEMLELTELIYQYRQKHVIDSRIRRLEALTEILTYLRDVGVTDDLGPYGHLVIQDVWDYFPRENRRRMDGRYFPVTISRGTSGSRSFGTRVRTGIGADYRYDNRQQTDLRNTESTYTRYHKDSAGIVDTSSGYTTWHSYYHGKNTSGNVYLTGLVEHHVPVSRKWQVDLSAQARYYIYADHDYSLFTAYYRDNRSSERMITEDWEYDDHYSLGFWASALYIVDSRTSLNVQALYNYEQVEYEVTRRQLVYNSSLTGGKHSYHSKYWQFLLSGGLIYRISIPTTLHINANYYRTSSEAVRDLVSNDYADDSYELSVSLSHYLF